MNVLFITYGQHDCSVDVAILSLRKFNPTATVIHVGERRCKGADVFISWQCAAENTLSILSNHENADERLLFDRLMTSSNELQCMVLQRLMRILMIECLGSQGWYSDTDMLYLSALPDIEESKGFAVGRHFGEGCNAGIFFIDPHTDVFTILKASLVKAYATSQVWDHHLDERVSNEVIEKNQGMVKIFPETVFGGYSIAARGWDGLPPADLFVRCRGATALHYCWATDEYGRLIKLLSREQLRNYKGEVRLVLA